MAIGTVSDFTIYQEEFYSGMFERVMQATEAFNAASANSIRLVPQAHKGDYMKSTFLQDIATLISRRVNTDVTAATDLNMPMGENVVVKLNRTIGPVATTLDQWKKLGENPSEMSLKLGQMIGEKKLVEMVNTALGSAVAAISTGSDFPVDLTAGTLKHSGLVDGIAKFGDRAGDIVAFVMHSKVWFDLLKESLTAASGVNEVFRLGEMAVFQGITATLGRAVVVTDSAKLGPIGTTPTYYTLGLVSDGVVLLESEEQDIVAQTVTGLKNLVNRIQGEYAYSLGMKGFAYDIGNGGANPDDTAITTATNWDYSVSSGLQPKGTCGISIDSQ